MSETTEKKQNIESPSETQDVGPSISFTVIFGKAKEEVCAAGSFNGMHVVITNMHSPIHAKCMKLSQDRKSVV